MSKKILLICLLFFLILTLLWVGFIFSNSLDNGEESSQKSSSVTDVINTMLVAVGINKPISEGAIRTLGHFSEFFALSLFLCADILIAAKLCPRRLRLPLSLLFAIPCSFAVACADEILQKFSAGRVCDLADVLVDTLGACGGTLVFMAALLAVRATRSLKTKRKAQ